LVLGVSRLLHRGSGVKLKMTMKALQELIDCPPCHF